jgi:hypothetical protein
LLLSGSALNTQALDFPLPFAFSSGEEKSNRYTRPLTLPLTPCILNDIHFSNRNKNHIFSFRSLGEFFSARAPGALPPGLPLIPWKLRRTSPPLSLQIRP